METSHLEVLLSEYRKAPSEYHATQYWQAYEKEIMQQISRADIERIRSGDYPVFATFGFNDTVHYYHPSLPLWRKLWRKLLRRYVLRTSSLLPYGLNTALVQTMAAHHAALAAQLAGAETLDSVQTSTFGAPSDLFEVEGKKYTMSFLNYFLRYCFAHKHLRFTGTETVVELGLGSGYQIEVMKKLYPRMTFLCFDLPAQIFLGEQYLAGALGEDEIVRTTNTLDWSDLSQLQSGKVHCFGNWQMPLLSKHKFDLFWNAASFGEMELPIVQNYLSFVRGNAENIYLLQARSGKETKSHMAPTVRRGITFEDYNDLLPDYQLIDQRDVYLAHRPMSQSGGYFEGIWAHTR